MAPQQQQQQPQQQPAVSDREKAELFCQLYADVSRVPRSKDDVAVNKEARARLGEACGCNGLCACAPFTIEHLQAAIKGLKSRKSPGSDGVSNDMLKRLPPRMDWRLLQLVNRAWRAAEVPAQWRCATIIPVIKRSKPASDPSSYRPWRSPAASPSARSG